LKENENINIKVNFNLEQNPNFRTSILLSVSENFKISGIIKIAVDKLNTILYNEKMNYRLVENYDKYEIKPSKKNGEPKLDLPSLDKDAQVGLTQLLNFSLIYKNENLVCIKKKDKCKICIVI
jgi:hypothetical protein